MPPEQSASAFAAPDAARAAGRTAVLAVAPIETAAPQREPLPTSATGLPAIINSLAVSLREMGPLRTADTWTRINQVGGFDCPSCAWADPLSADRHVIEFCENGAKALADDATTRRVDADFFRDHDVAELSQQSDHWLNAQGRLTEPMVLRPGAMHYEPISWPDAFALVGRELRGLGSPDEAIFYTSGKVANEPAFLYQLFARQFGTNNLPDCSNMCHESSGVGLKDALGVGKSTVTLADMESSSCIIIVGQNPGTNHPRMLSSLRAAKKNGATIIAINPLREVGLLRFKHPQKPQDILGHGVDLADHYLQVRINGDVALIKGFCKAMLEAEDRAPGTVLDTAFIREHTHGFADFAEHVRAADWQEIVEGSGIDEATIRSVAGVLAAAPTTVAAWAMGLTQHKNGVENIREFVNLLLLRGNVGKPGAGALCVRGHSNVQGDRTMGIWEQMDDHFLDALGREFRFEPPRAHGYDTVQAIAAMAAGKARVFVSLGGNFLAATPDTHLVADALRRCSLTVSIATKLNRSHLVTGETALILPCLGRTDRDVQASGPQLMSVENTVSVVSRTEGRLTPASSYLLSEVAIIAGLAKATLGQASQTDWDGMVGNYDRIRDAVSRVVPGFEEFNRRVREPDGFYAPVPAKDRDFHTMSGKAEFTINDIPSHGLEAGQLLMMTIRTHDQFNTVVYGLDDRYRGTIGGRRVIYLNAADIAAAGLQAGERVDITSHFQGETRIVRSFLVVPYDIPRGCAATYYPETNPLVPLGSVAERSGTPTYKSVIISVARAAA